MLRIDGGFIQRDTVRDDMNVDQPQVVVLDHQVRRLDVSVCDPDVPHAADQLEPFVDDHLQRVITGPGQCQTRVIHHARRG